MRDSKTTTLWVCAGFSLLIIGGGIFLTSRFWAPLEARRLNGILLLFVILMTFAQLGIMITLVQTQETRTPTEMVWQFAKENLRAAGIFGAVSLAFAAVFYIISIPTRLGNSYLLFPLLFLLAPLVAIVIDMVQKTVKATPRNLLFGYAIYAYKIYILLLGQFIYIPIAFVLFPAGFFLQFLSIVDMIVRWFNLAPTDPIPLLCDWGNVPPDYCAPALVGFHIGHLILAVIAARYSDKLLDMWANLLGRGIEALESWIEK
ncbi:MAG: hypothetical protein AAF614_25355 [Chloroflexota bacterium]